MGCCEFVCQEEYAYVLQDVYFVVLVCMCVGVYAYIHLIFYVPGYICVYMLDTKSLYINLGASDGSFASQRNYLYQ